MKYVSVLTLALQEHVLYSETDCISADRKHIDPLKTNINPVIYKDSIRTAQ